ncbi:uncharacterized protein LOC111612825 [Centruroides sculpturatus]|uniref:uncharacterized protein LOC111612825 n=1 Tax=Centruroides sculpturatus TaxID=218467 RepID=UPI000C6CC2C2|nr:uncharacterized protein LOC111612825 [Centruroides sculpturatus]
MEIYTDGSGLDGNIGCTFVVMQNSEIHQQGYRLSNFRSVFQAKLEAVNMAVGWSEQHLTHTQIAIFTDCQSAINLINSRQLHPISTAIKKLTLNSSNSYSITWVRSHHGTTGNERADQLAKTAANNDTLDSIYNKISLNKVKTSIQ